MATREEVRKVLADAGYRVREERAIQYGHQLKLASGESVSVYHKGTYHVQGPNSSAVKERLDVAFALAGLGPAGQVLDRAFVVYGHDEAARAQLEAMLRRWGIEPLFLDQLPSAGQTIIEKLEEYRDQAGYAVVLATPDDEGHRVGCPDKKMFRVRQNVVLELGMMLALLGRAKVAILLRDREGMERPSDIDGLIYLRFRDSVNETSLALAREMNAQGASVNPARP